jgi:AcrR family transcriptional regulator
MRILTEAVAMADEEGLAKLSMRKLAGRLGFEVMSLYNHVANKDDLHAAMVDLVVTEVALHDADEDWRTAMRQHCVATKEMLLRHPWAVMLWVTTVPGPARFDHMEWELATLATAGLDPDTAHQAFHALSNHVVGYSLQASLMDLDQNDPAVIEIIGSLDDGRYPNVIEHIRQHLAGEHGASFEFVLDLLLAGIADQSKPA